MSLEIGKINQLKVKRKTDISYLLQSTDGEEVFLHVNETDFKTLEPNEIVSAFLYLDFKGRLAATLKSPILQVDEKGFLVVKSVTPKLGVFLDLGISKDILLSKDDLGLDESLWPREGEKLFVTVKVKSKLVAKLIPVSEIISNHHVYDIGEEVEGIIQGISSIGYFVLTDNLDLILVKKSNTRNQYRYGEKVKVKITYQSKKGYEGSLIESKEVIRVDDSKFILDYLKKHKQMPYTSDTDSETIMEVFGLSRKAFKRALGLLYKKRLIKFIDRKTYLVSDNE
ncbi:MAG TPA: hypothetical protein GYA04_01140 [Acholeplasma sp.]|nr:hypothetical protein [Acholeplasma sp.]